MNRSHRHNTISAQGPVCCDELFDSGNMAYSTLIGYWIILQRSGRPRARGELVKSSKLSGKSPTLPQVHWSFADFSSIATRVPRTLGPTARYLSKLQRGRASFCYLRGPASRSLRRKRAGRVVGRRTTSSGTGGRTRSTSARMVFRRTASSTRSRFRLRCMCNSSLSINRFNH